MYESIMVAVDPYNPASVEQAIAIANNLKSEQGKITLSTVLADIPPYAAEYVPVGQADLNQKKAESQLNGYAANHGDLETQVISSSSSAGATLVQLATENETDLIIIVSHRPGLRDYFLGSTAGRVVRHSPCAVHVLR